MMGKTADIVFRAIGCCNDSKSNYSSSELNVYNV
jgi:hypothetical protein